MRRDGPGALRARRQRALPVGGARRGALLHARRLLQEPSYSPSAIAAHGAAGLDVIGVDFSTCSAYFCGLVAADGGVGSDCDDGGDHLASMASRARTMGAVATRFFDENRWGSPADYAAGLPSYLPDYYKLVE